MARAIRNRSMARPPAVFALSTMIASMMMGAHGTLVTAEYQALLELYNQPDANNNPRGDSWSTKTNWLSGDPCENKWAGVYCDASNTHVTSLYLSSFGITGSITAGLGDLPELVTLQLNDNDFEGSIPSALGNLAKLDSLSVQNNVKMSGPIPVELSQLTVLSTLYLTNIGLTGSIPLELGSMARLLFLRLDVNTLSGTLPDELGNLKALISFNINNNPQLTGTVPASFSNLNKLGYFIVHDTDLYGPVPSLNAGYLLSDVANTDLCGGTVLPACPACDVTCPDSCEVRASGPKPEYCIGGNGGGSGGNGGGSGGNGGGSGGNGGGSGGNGGGVTCASDEVQVDSPPYCVVAHQTSVQVQLCVANPDGYDATWFTEPGQITDAELEAAANAVTAVLTNQGVAASGYDAQFTTEGATPGCSQGGAGRRLAATASYVTVTLQLTVSKATSLTALTIANILNSPLVLSSISYSGTLGGYSATLVTVSSSGAVTSAASCDPSCSTCSISADANSCTSCPQGKLLDAQPMGKCVATTCDVACLYGCDAPTSTQVYDSVLSPTTVSSLLCTGPLFQRCAAGYFPSFTRSIGCEVATVGVARLDVCIAVPKGSEASSIPNRLGPEDINAAIKLFVQQMRKAGVATAKVGVRFESVSASAKCEHVREDRALRKSESKVDGDQGDNIGLSFELSVFGNGVDVNTAVRAAQHLRYARTDAVIFRSPVLLNYGDGAVVPSQECDSSCETCLDTSKDTCTSCRDGFTLSSHSDVYGKCVRRRD